MISVTVNNAQISKVIHWLYANVSNDAYDFAHATLATGKTVTFNFKEMAQAWAFKLAFGQAPFNAE